MVSLRHKLLLGFAGLLGVLLLLSTLMVVVFTRYSHAIQRAFSENYNSAIYCDAMRDALGQLNQRAQFMLWSVPTTQPIDPAAQFAHFDANLQRQIDNCTLQGELQATQALAQMWTQYRQDYARFNTAPAAQRPQIYRDALLPEYQRLMQQAQFIGGRNMANMAWVDQSARRTLVDVRDSALALVIAGTLLSAVIVWAVSAAILHPLRALTRSAREMEAGNLDLQLAFRSGDELGQLVAAFNAMSLKLAEFRRLDRDRLLRSQQTTQLAIDSLPDAVFIVGPTGVVEISNRTAAVHFGVEPGVTVAQLDQKLKWLHPLYETAHEGHISEEPVGYRSAVQLFDSGHERFLLPRAVPMIGPDGATIGVTFILVDVTRLRAADEAKSSVVSTVSHELRTPLTAVRMALSLLSGEKFGPLTARQTTLLQAAREDSDRLHRIIENLLSISRIESGAIAFAFQPLAPRDIIAQALEPLRSAFAEKKMSVAVDAPDDLPAALADPAAIGSALSNLLSNALKFTPPGGSVRVAAEASAFYVCFSVTDTGPGIPPEHAARVFDKFFRVPTRQGPTGAGLGLAIAKEVVEAHGGHIELRPAANGVSGCTFAFTLRRADAPASDLSGSALQTSTAS